MNDFFSGINNEVLRIFFRHCCIAFRRYEDREFALQGLREQLGKLKQLAKKKAHKQDLSAEFEELEDKIAVALEKETRIIKHVFDEESFNSKLHARISALDAKLGSYLNVREQRSNRMKELEQKVRGKIVVEKGSDGKGSMNIRQKLEELEAQLKRLSSHKSGNRIKLQLLQGKVDMLKARL